MHSITKEQLLELFEYKDGKLFWKVIPSANVILGQEAGSIKKDQYRSIKIKAKLFRTHRLIFFMHHGYLPEMVDHINGDTLDNRIENLRSATKEQNQHNARISSKNTSGVKGLSWDKKCKRWIARIKLKGKSIYLGCFNDIELAELVMAEARSKYHGQFANNG